jgi:hypothetical protein
MTWVLLTNTERNKIAYVTRPYIVDCYEPHEAEVRQRNPRDDWHGLTKEERQATLAEMEKPFYMKDLLAAIEAKLKEKNT